MDDVDSYRLDDRELQCLVLMCRVKKHDPTRKNRRSEIDSEAFRRHRTFYSSHMADVTLTLMESGSFLM